MATTILSTLTGLGITNNNRLVSTIDVTLAANETTAGAAAAAATSASPNDKCSMVLPPISNFSFHVVKPDQLGLYLSNEFDFANENENTSNKRPKKEELENEQAAKSIKQALVRKVINGIGMIGSRMSHYFNRLFSLLPQIYFTRKMKDGKPTLPRAFVDPFDTFDAFIPNLDITTLYAKSTAKESQGEDFTHHECSLQGLSPHIAIALLAFVFYDETATRHFIKDEVKDKPLTVDYCAQHKKEILEQCFTNRQYFYMSSSSSSGCKQGQGEEEGRGGGSGGSGSSRFLVLKDLPPLLMLYFLRLNKASCNEVLWCSYKNSQRLGDWCFKVFGDTQNKQALEELLNTRTPSITESLSMMQNLEVTCVLDPDQEHAKGLTNGLAFNTSNVTTALPKLSSAVTDVWSSTWPLIGQYLCFTRLLQELGHCVPGSKLYGLTLPPMMTDTIVKETEYVMYACEDLFMKEEEELEHVIEQRQQLKAEEDQLMLLSTTLITEDASFEGIFKNRIKRMRAQEDTDAMAQIELYFKEIEELKKQNKPMPSSILLAAPEMPEESARLSSKLSLFTDYWIHVAYQYIRCGAIQGEIKLGSNASTTSQFYGLEKRKIMERIERQKKNRESRIETLKTKTKSTPSVMSFFQKK